MSRTEEIRNVIAGGGRERHAAAPGTYVGDPRSRRVTFNGRVVPSYSGLRNHSPTGFMWGYGGSGPAQLALALVAHALGVDAGERPKGMFGLDVSDNARRALSVYQEFKCRVVAKLEMAQPWELSKEFVMRTIEEIESGERGAQSVD